MNDTVYRAFEMICDTGHREVVDEGFALMKSLADAGDMTASAYLGFCCSLKHVGHYDLEMCREYLEKAAQAADPQGQFYLGEMLLFGEPPFRQDPVYGKWLLEQAAAAGNSEAERILWIRYGRPRTGRDEGRRNPIARFMDSVRNLFMI